MLKFIGTGSCFNYKMGNNSAYYIHNTNDKKRFVLFDCGEDVFHKILKNDLLNGINEVFVIITHLHSDHIGSLPSIIFYLHYALNIKPVVFFPNDDLNVFLKLGGVNSDYYEYVGEKNSYYDLEYETRENSHTFLNDIRVLYLNFIKMQQNILMMHI